MSGKFHLNEKTKISQFKLRSDLSQLKTFQKSNERLLFYCGSNAGPSLGHRYGNLSNLLSTLLTNL